MVEIKPNAPCPCGSGKKYKKCCAGTGSAEKPIAACPSADYYAAPETPTDDKGYLAELKAKYPDAELYGREDENWNNDGQDFLKAGDFEKAETIFGKLVVSQPGHHDGYQGLAQTYFKTGQKDKAVWFIEKAVFIAREFLESGSIDMEVIEEMERMREIILDA
ncbi:MAG: SEC-C metal-binding domain-containing protein [bacterium]